MRSLFEDFGVSSILVIGGSGDYFQVSVKSFRIALTPYSTDSIGFKQQRQLSYRKYLLKINICRALANVAIRCDDSFLLAFYIVDKEHFQVTVTSAVEVNI